MARKVHALETVAIRLSEHVKRPTTLASAHQKLNTQLSAWTYDRIIIQVVLSANRTCELTSEDAAYRNRYNGIFRFIFSVPYSVSSTSAETE